jgi:hypothetical protein
MVECRFDVAGVGINLPTFGATLLRALRDWGVSMANESSVVSFPAGKLAKATAKNRASKSPNYHLEQSDWMNTGARPRFSTMRSSFCSHGYRIDHHGAGPATARPALRFALSSEPHE